MQRPANNPATARDESAGAPPAGDPDSATQGETPRSPSGPVLVCTRDRDHDVPVALFTTRAAADAFIGLWDAAVRRSQADGVNGICQVGDLYVEGVEVDPTDLRAYVDEHLYLSRYLEPR